MLPTHRNLPRSAGAAISDYIQFSEPHETADWGRSPIKRSATSARAGGTVEVGCVSHLVREVNGSGH